MKKFEDLKGKTLVGIEGDIGDEVMRFTTASGEVGVLYYSHD
jgi:hypothetical protein